MPSLLILVAVSVASIALAFWIRGKWEDAALEREMDAMQRRVYAELPPADLERLSLQILEIKAAGVQAAKEGMNARSASRMIMRGAIQQMAAFLEIERMFTAPHSRV